MKSTKTEITMANYSIERKSYNKLTAQIARNVARKKILEIRSRGAQAADELIDDLLEKSAKNPKSAQKSPLKDQIKFIIERNRVKWRNFIIEIAGRFDAEWLSTVGVALIYGGIITSSLGNEAWASVVSIEQKDLRALTETVSKGRNRGSMVWILRGEEVFSPEIIKVCRYFPECVFVLAAGREFDASALSGVKNTLVLLPKGDQKSEKELLRQGTPYIFADRSDPIFDTRRKGSGEILSTLPPSLMSFLEAPRFPIFIEDMSCGLNSVEFLLSGGKNKSIPYYFA